VIPSFFKRAVPGQFVHAKIPPVAASSIAQSGFHEKISPVYWNFKKACAALIGNTLIPNTSELP